MALTILALRDYSSGVVDEQCSAEVSLSMSQETPGACVQHTTCSTGWFMQAVTGLDKDYMSVLEKAEESGTFWKEAELSLQPGVG